MIAKSVDFDADFADFDVVFVDFDVDFVIFNADFVDFTDFSLKLVKLTISFHSTVRIQGRNINFCQNPQFFIKSMDFLISA